MNPNSSQEPLAGLHNNCGLASPSGAAVKAKPYGRPPAGLDNSYPDEDPLRFLGHALSISRYRNVNHQLGLDRESLTF